MNKLNSALLVATTGLFLLSANAHAANTHKFYIVLPTVKARLSVSIGIGKKNRSTKQVVHIAKKRARGSRAKDKAATRWSASFSERQVKKATNFCVIMNTRRAYFKVKGKLLKSVCWKLNKNEKKHAGYVLSITEKK